MPYNPETEEFYQAPATIVDSTPDGDTVQEGFDDRLTPAMAGLYADLNLLKADGMISVGIPATTTARGIGRVATAADMLPGSTITNGPAFLDAATVKITPTPTANAVPQAGASGTLDAWVSPDSGKADTVLSNLKPAAQTVIRNAMKAKDLGSRTTSGAWTLTGVEIGLPLFIVTDSSGTEGDQGGRLKVTSGATGGASGSTDGTYLIGRGVTQLSSNVFVTFPTSSTVVIAVASVSNATISARQ